MKIGLHLGQFMENLTEGVKKIICPIANQLHNWCTQKAKAKRTFIFIDREAYQLSGPKRWPAWRAVWPDWPIYWNLGNFSKPVAIISLLKSPTFLAIFCEVVQIFNFSLISFWATFIDIFTGHTADQPLSVSSQGTALISCAVHEIKSFFVFGFCVYQL